LPSVGSGGAVLDRAIDGISTKWSSGSPAGICTCGRAVDHEGEVLEILVQRRRDKRAAVKLMRKLLCKQGFAPKTVTTDKLRSYAAAFQHFGLSCQHEQGLRENNRAENSHQAVRRRAIRAPVPSERATPPPTHWPRGSSASTNYFKALTSSTVFCGSGR
jgi:hypothetical protein